MDAGRFDLDAYLRRIGCARPLAPSAAALRELHRAHVAKIPFENLDILLGREIRIDLASLQAKLVRGGRGGYCFEHNTLFQAALEAIGFEVTALAARVRQGAESVRPRTHMLLRVGLPEGPFVADVGFGGDGLVQPLAWEAGLESWLGGVGHRLRREGQDEGPWVLERSFGDAWQDLYAFTLEPQLPVDFEMANHFTSTWPRSPFLNRLTAQRCLPERRLILRDRQLTLREGRSTETLEVRDPDHLLALLAGHFGLAFPPGTRFSQPRF
jgi:N-hydroxyarylamine O-acetyltransferase